MASIGLGIAQGNNLYQQDIARKQENAMRQEELDRFLMGRALYETQLANETVQADTMNKELTYFENMYSTAQPHFEGIMKGDANSFANFSNDLGLGYEYDSANNVWYKDGKNIGKLSSDDMQRVVSDVVVQPYSSMVKTAQGMDAAEALDAQFMRDLALSQSKLRPAAGSGSGSYEDTLEDMYKLLNDPDKRKDFEDQSKIAAARQMFGDSVLYDSESGTFYSTSEDEDAMLSPYDVKMLEEIAGNARNFAYNTGFRDLMYSKQLLQTGALNYIADRENYVASMGPRLPNGGFPETPKAERQPLPETPIIGGGISGAEINSLVPTAKVVGTGVSNFVKGVGSSINDAAHTGARYIGEHIVVPYGILQ